MFWHHEQLLISRLKAQIVIYQNRQGPRALNFPGFGSGGSVLAQSLQRRHPTFHHNHIIMAIYSQLDN